MDNKIINYIKYLRDASKSFSVPGNMSFSLLSLKSKNEYPVRISLLENSINKNSITLNQNNFPSFFYQLFQSNLEKQVYLGTGFIIGKSNKKIFSNICYFPVSFTSSTEISFQMSDVIINLDLITSILPSYVSFEEAFNNVELVESLHFMEDNLSNMETFDLNKISNIIKTFITSLNTIYPEVNILPYSENFNYSEITKSHSIFNKKELFFNTNELFLFSNKKPSNISTWKALDSFAEHIDNQNFEHKVLNYLFHNIFSKTSYLEKNSIDDKQIRDVLQILPIELSEKQQIGLKNCFEYPISYIQGPPGTGKSHTISAIILAAYLMKKKVLVVSQKNTALNVVKNNLLPFFSKELSIPFIYFEKDKKSELKESINDLLNNTLIKTHDFYKFNKSVEFKQQEISILNNKLDEVGNEINTILHNMNKFSIDNKKFQYNKSILLNNPVYKIHKDQEVTKLKNTPNNILLKIKIIEDKYKINNSINHYELFKIKQIEKLLQDKFNLNISLSNYVKKGLAYDFLQDWFKLNCEYKINQDQQDKNISDQPLLQHLRYNKDLYVQNIKEKSSDLFKDIHKCHLLESLETNENKKEITNFKKMLHWSKADTILQRMENIDFNIVSEVFPIWLSEIRNIGEILPLNEEMFDLIIVDEASQVNLAEILPIFYRGKNICILGDHKQLGLNSVGVNFLLQTKKDALTWEQYLGKDISYNMGKEQNLIITNSSILEMLISDHNYTSFPSVMLDEHWRCLPNLISFSNKKYYNNKLKIMTQTPEKTLSPQIAGIKVAGHREDKINKVEANKIIEIIKFLTQENKNNDLNKEIPLSSFIKDKRANKTLSIGVISLLRDQVELINDLIKEKFPEGIIEDFDILCGTAEEYQGEEKDIIIHSFVVDKNSRNAKHYSDEKRFNVATTRAKFYNIVVYSEVSNIPIFKEYLHHLNILKFEDETQNLIETTKNWKFDYELMDSDFERNIFDTLLFELNKISNKIYYYNQVETIGYKLDFVFYNSDNHKSVAIEVDGRYHFEKHSNEYTSHHKERIDILKKAGWKIINTADFSWYHNGFFDINHYKSKKEIERIINEIKIILDL